MAELKDRTTLSEGFHKVIRLHNILRKGAEDVSSRLKYFGDEEFAFDCEMQQCSRAVFRNVPRGLSEDAVPFDRHADRKQQPSYFDRPFVWESSDSTSRRTAIRKSTGRVAAKSSRRNHRRRRRRRENGGWEEECAEKWWDGAKWGEGRGAGDAPRANSLPRFLSSHLCESASSRRSFESQCERSSGYPPPPFSPSEGETPTTVVSRIVSPRIRHVYEKREIEIELARYPPTLSATGSPARSADSRVIDERYRGKRSIEGNEASKGHRQRDHAIGELERKSRRLSDTGRITPRSAAIIVSDDVEE
ncbi:hypothetical protein EAG_03415 [Camponotus floridanus]|uniref:Uncharacterized protein n=1 Tax=Camponotus floridanus TaxID=104421 RepID=E2AQG5_CAMFO|nr:hypothetical protein EAG_03415 [Camponotus floridanus]